MLNLFFQMSLSRRAWLLLAIMALGLEGAALYFQYGMGMEPCVMCIYQRIAVAGIAAAGILGAIYPNSLVLRTPALMLWLSSATWGAYTAYQHVEIQQNTNPFAFFTCESIPNLPSWFALHEWFPAVFEASGDCGSIDWVFLGLSMPEWMIVNFTLLSIVAVMVVLSQIRHHIL